MPTDDFKKILIVDDDADVILLTSAFLKARNYRCVQARSGAQALREFASGDVDLIITDLNMPSGDGIDVVLNIRQHSWVPVIIVSGFGTEYAERVRFLPNVTLVNKPFELQGLLELVGMELSPGMF